MIERANEFGAPPAALVVDGDSAHLSAGGILRQAREAQGLHIEVVAAVLKVSPRKLAALEADDIASLPDPVFARALAASVCRTLRIDPAPVLAKLPEVRRPGLADVEQTLGKTVRPPPPRSETGAGFSRPLLIAILLLVIGAAALFWLPQPLLDRIGDSVARLMQREAPEAPAIEAPMAESPPPAAQAEPAAAAITTEPVAAAPPAPVEPAPVEPAAAPEPASAPVAPVPPTDAGGDLIVFTARGDAWISVTGSNDGKLLERVVKAGETVGLNGTGTLSVTVGRASGVDVQVRGKPFDMTRLMSPGGVARFEVRPE